MVRLPCKKALQPCQRSATPATLSGTTAVCQLDHRHQPFPPSLLCRAEVTPVRAEDAAMPHAYSECRKRKLPHTCLRAASCQEAEKMPLCSQRRVCRLAVMPTPRCPSCSFPLPAGRKLKQAPSAVCCLISQPNAGQGVDCTQQAPSTTGGTAKQQGLVNVQGG